MIDGEGFIHVHYRKNRDTTHPRLRTYCTTKETLTESCRIMGVNPFPRGDHGNLQGWYAQVSEAKAMKVLRIVAPHPGAVETLQGTYDTPNLGRRWKCSRDAPLRRPASRLPQPQGRGSLPKRIRADFKPPIEARWGSQTPYGGKDHPGGLIRFEQRDPQSGGSNPPLATLWRAYNSRRGYRKIVPNSATIRSAEAPLLSFELLYAATSRTFIFPVLYNSLITMAASSGVSPAGVG